MEFSHSLSPVDNPWVAAQEFIDREELPKEFLDQIAQFIYQNTKGVNIGATSGIAFNPFSGIITKKDIHSTFLPFASLFRSPHLSCIIFFQIRVLLIMTQVVRVPLIVLSFIHISLWYALLYIYHSINLSTDIEIYPNVDV